MDRLVLIYEDDRLVAADVIDFKSDAISPHDLQSKVAQYGPQLATYREAMSEVLGLPITAISTRLAFISTGDVINLDMIEATVDASTKLKPNMRSKPKTADVSAGNSASEQNSPAQSGRVKRVVNQPKREDGGASRNKRVVDQHTEGYVPPIEPVDKSKESGTAATGSSQGEKAKTSRKTTGKRRPPKVSPGQKTLWDD